MNNRKIDINPQVGKGGKLLSALLVVAVVVLTITFSIGLPIYVRPFYYVHIEALDMPYDTDLTVGQSREAYDEVLDYLTLPGKEFSVGVMEYSESGRDHFVDCKALFDLNATVLLLSAATVIAILLLKKRGKVELCTLNSYHPIFYSGLLAILIPAILGMLISVDFDRAFVVFHKIFFPGKDNWTFDPRYDEIIMVLPEEFFRNCAILIGVGILTLGSVAMIYAVVKRRRKINK